MLYPPEYLKGLLSFAGRSAKDALLSGLDL
jgi:hypothetical protein